MSIKSRFRRSTDEEYPFAARGRAGEAVVGDRRAPHLAGARQLQLDAIGLLTAHRLHAGGWALVGYLLWLSLSGLLVAGIELLARTV
jgi:hypothetical protein